MQGRLHGVRGKLISVGDGSASWRPLIGCFVTEDSFMKKLIRLILTRIVEDVILRTESEEFDEPGKGQDIE